MTIAEMAASYSLRAFSIFFERGDAEATSGFCKFKPRYVVERSIIFVSFFR
jgi:hypothetical protein